MCNLQRKVDITSGCRIYTQYPLEEYTFTWNITNFSKIFNDVSTQFATSSNATVWQLKLVERKWIELQRCFHGASVKVHYACSLVTCGKTLRIVESTMFNKISDKYVMMTFGDPNFENDIFTFNCTLSIQGHSITNKTESTGIALLNSKQLSLDFKDLFKRQEYCDLTISVADNKIQVHKAILCARSPAFDKMFQYAMIENESNQIELNDIDFDVLQDFLFFLYSGEMKELCFDRAMHLYYVADKYEVKDLRIACSQFLEYHFTTDRVCDVLKLADMHKDEKLKNAAKYFIKMYSFDVQSTKDWKELVKTHPKLAAEILK